ncbi:MAG: zf-HC2 domain-containing protein [Candidatus Methylomirabilales bacterium]
MMDTSTCQETQEYLQEFMDDTLAPDQGGRVQAHLETCQACASDLAVQRDIRNRVAAGVPRREPPAELRRKVSEILTPKEPRVWGLLPRPALQWGLAFATLVLISLVSLAVLNRGERIPPILIEAVNDHHSFVMRGTPPTEPTADPHQVRKWLAAKVGFEVDPPMGRPADLRFMGGDVTYFLERRVACLLYGKGHTLVSLFVLPDQGVEVPRTGFRRVDGLEIYVTSREGYGVALWKKGDLLYTLVTELPPDELVGVAKDMVRT